MARLKFDLDYLGNVDLVEEITTLQESSDIRSNYMTIEEMVEFVYGRDGEADIDELIGRQESLREILTPENYKVWDGLPMEEVDKILDSWND